MKRLKKAIHIALVWISVCLLLVDPAAACRLLAGRRCCCCCPCAQSACTMDAPVASVESSPTDTPPSTNADAGPLPPAAAAPIFGEPFRASPALVTPASPHQPPAMELTIPRSPRTNTNRQPLEIYPPVAAGVELPPAGTTAAGTIQRPTLDSPGPMPADLKPRQNLEPTVG